MLKASEGFAFRGFFFVLGMLWARCRCGRSVVYRAVLRAVTAGRLCTCPGASALLRNAGAPEHAPNRLFCLHCMALILAITLTTVPCKLHHTSHQRHRQHHDGDAVLDELRALLAKAQRSGGR